MLNCRLAPLETGLTIPVTYRMEIRPREWLYFSLLFLAEWRQGDGEAECQGMTVSGTMFHPEIEGEYVLEDVQCRGNPTYVGVTDRKDPNATAMYIYQQGNWFVGGERCSLSPLDDLLIGGGPNAQVPEQVGIWREVREVGSTPVESKNVIVSCSDPRRWESSTIAAVATVMIIIIIVIGVLTVKCYHNRKPVNQRNDQTEPSVCYINGGLQGAPPTYSAAADPAITFSSPLDTTENIHQHETIHQQNIDIPPDIGGAECAPEVLATGDKPGLCGIAGREIN